MRRDKNGEDKCRFASRVWKDRGAAPAGRTTRRCGLSTRWIATTTSSSEPATTGSTAAAYLAAAGRTRPGPRASSTTSVGRPSRSGSSPGSTPASRATPIWCRCCRAAWSRISRLDVRLQRRRFSSYTPDPTNPGWGLLVDNEDSDATARAFRALTLGDDEYGGLEPLPRADRPARRADLADRARAAAARPTRCVALVDDEQLWAALTAGPARVADLGVLPRRPGPRGGGDRRADRHVRVGPLRGPGPERLLPLPRRRRRVGEWDVPDRRDGRRDRGPPAGGGLGRRARWSPAPRSSRSTRAARSLAAGRSIRSARTGDGPRRLRAGHAGPAARGGRRRAARRSGGGRGGGCPAQGQPAAAPVAGPAGSRCRRWLPPSRAPSTSTRH